MAGLQLTLDLPGRDRMGRADFLVAPSNARALAAVEAPQGWADGALLLLGARGTGRSHLAHIFADETGARLASGAGFRLPDVAPAYAVDDADRVAGDGEAEEALFHLINRARGDGAPLLLTARDGAGTWGLGLPDLLSRALAMPTARLDLPDEALMEMALIKLFDDRQLVVSAETVAYLVARMERSLSAARALVEALDHAALSGHKRVSRALAAETLRACSAPDPAPRP